MHSTHGDPKITRRCKNEMIPKPIVDDLKHLRRCKVDSILDVQSHCTKSSVQEPLLLLVLYMALIIMSQLQYTLCPLQWVCDEVKAPAAKAEAVTIAIPEKSSSTSLPGHTGRHNSARPSGEGCTRQRHVLNYSSIGMKYEVQEMSLSSELPAVALHPRQLRI